jgi:hypothetical protein
MKNGTSHRSTTRQPAQTAGLSIVPGSADISTTVNLRAAQGPQPVSSLESGILVREEELISVKAQRLYKMRCECGRSWFELELPRFVECPACKKLGLVSA